VIANLVFAALSIAMLVCAVSTVHSKDLVRAVLWLAATLLATAALYAMLDAPFLSGVQVLTYVGGVVTLMIFGVMVTRRHDRSRAAAANAQRLRGALAAAALFAVLCAAIAKTDLSGEAATQPIGTSQIASSLFDTYLIAFEALSLLLLAAIVGAVVLARRRDPAAETDARVLAEDAKGAAR
jgi:NADH-quinone oxidoreductase subunit J